MACEAQRSGGRAGVHVGNGEQGIAKRDSSVRVYETKFLFYGKTRKM